MNMSPLFVQIWKMGKHPGRLAAGLTLLFILIGGSRAGEDFPLYLPLVYGPSWSGPEGWVRDYPPLILRDVVEDNAGNFVAAGGHLTANYPGAVFMVDPAGEVLWARLHQIGQYGRLQQVHALAEGGFIAVGTSPSYEGIPIVQHFSDGSIAWQQWLDVPQLDRVDSDLTDDGGLILAGGESYRSFTWRLDANGVLVWQRELGDTGNNTLNAVRQLEDGSFIAAGQTTSAGAGNWDGWIIHLDAVGNALWQKSYGTSEAEQIYAIAPAGDGGLIAAGGAYFADRHSGWVFKVNRDGQVQWSRIFDRFDSASFSHLLVATDGSIFLSGVSTLYDPYLAEGWLVKLNGDGILQWQRGIEGGAVSGQLRQTSDGGLIMAGFGLLLHLNQEGYVRDCPMLHRASGTVAEFPVLSSDYPYSPSPGNHTTGGNWYVTDFSLSSTLLCPQIQKFRRAVR